jgi:hypothetical protein
MLNIKFKCYSKQFKIIKTGSLKKKTVRLKYLTFPHQIRMRFKVNSKFLPPYYPVAIQVLSKMLLHRLPLIKKLLEV